MTFIPSELIKKKRNKLVHTKDEIQFLISAYTNGDLPDYQMSAWLMSVFFNGLNDIETADLTQAMIHSGKALDFSYLPEKAVDKHSTGGVGDKTSLILGPIVAAGGLFVPMISGRGLGHTGGTLDKLESIPGFSTQLTIDRFKTQTAQLGLCFIGQTQEICPADKKIYALRDVTATVESLPLICASIMSKKIAEGISGLVLDVKFGDGAFMKSPEQARVLAQGLKTIGEHAGLKVTALLTNMNQPLGRYIGNALEIEECLSILRNEDKQNQFADTKELSLILAAHMFVVGNKAKTPQEGYSLAQTLLHSGKAFEKFAEVVKAQGGNLKQLPQAKIKQDLFTSAQGIIHQIKTESLGVAGIALKAGRKSASDSISPANGLIIHKKIGDLISPQEPWCTLLGDSQDDIAHAKELLKTALELDESAPQPVPLILETLM